MQDFVQAEEPDFLLSNQPLANIPVCLRRSQESNTSITTLMTTMRSRAIALHKKLVLSMFTLISPQLTSTHASLSVLMHNLQGMIYTSDNNPNYNLIFVSDGCEKLTGYTAAELMGEIFTGLDGITHPEDRAYVHQTIKEAVAKQQPYELHYRLVVRSGEIRWVWDQGIGIFNPQGELQTLEGFISDISAMKQAEAKISLLQDLTQVIGEAVDFSGAMTATLQRVCQATHWQYGEAWVPGGDGTFLQASPAWYVHIKDPAQQALEQKFLLARREIQKFTFQKGEGLVGQVWSGRSIWMDNASTSADFKRREIAQVLGLKAAVGVPVLAGEEVVAVLVFFMLQSRPEDESLMQLISAVAAQLGVALQRKQAVADLEESQRRLSTLIDSLPGIAFVCRSDPFWATTYMSEGCLKLTGYRSEELLGSVSLYQGLAHAKDRASIDNDIAEALAQQQPYVVEYRIRTKTGATRWVWEKGQGVFDETGAVIGIEGFITDISDRKHSETIQDQLFLALQQAEESYRSIFENAMEGIFQSTPQGNYIRVNPALAKIYGYPSTTELVNSLTNIGQQLYKDPRRRQEFQDLLREHDFVADFESEVYRYDGSLIWISENARTVRDELGNLLHYEGTVQDITERKRDKEQLQKQALYDVLTGLPNRALFHRRLSQALEKLRLSPDYKFAVLYIDLDRFKAVNDSLGHGIGDLLLQAISRVLESCVRNGDTVARLGGDEFTILLEGIKDISYATQIAERIHRSLRSPFNLEGNEVFSGASIGIIMSSEVTESPDALLRDADTALYRAKALGKGRYEVFDQEMHKTAVELLQLEDDIRQAVETIAVQERQYSEDITEINWQIPKEHDRNCNGKSEDLVPKQFQVYYQPIISLTTGKIKGFEALLRWQHPIRGFVHPDKFIPLAQETGLLIPIGWWLLRHACWQLRIWQLEFVVKNTAFDRAAQNLTQNLTQNLNPNSPPQRLRTNPEKTSHLFPPWTINVNISAHELFHPELINRIDSILEETGLLGKYINLEITESTLLEKPELANQILAQLRTRGIELSIDDFGTGYSSLSYLYHFPINTLKIDRFFVSPRQGNSPNLDLIGQYPPPFAKTQPPLKSAPLHASIHSAKMPSSIVKTIILLGKSLEMEVVAEGIETYEQLKNLQDLGCDYGQGFWFSQPLDVIAATNLVRSNLDFSL
ncbi:MAG: EAL domain-containing protein [Coleofasciculaceae cyanobacterium SM2_1_6]|nr:EAL domain-containing protein [Coleofasciculaceae cyanobacterium SM2_1_6]